jgi:uncharacterized protein
MSLLERIQSDVKDAMRARDSDRTQNLRMLVNSLQKDAKEKQRDLTEQEEVAVLSRERKQRVEAAEAFEAGGATDRAAVERTQLALIEEYLPSQLGEDELAALVSDAVAEAGASSPKDMGAVMKVLMPKVQGRADGKAVSAAVQRQLTSA